jgi:death on curing protein
MSREWAHLTPAVVLAIHREVIAAHGGSTGVRDGALLESAVAAAQATAWGEPVFKDGIEIAAAYLFYICRNHPFLDGNKRTALASCLVFLERNSLLYHENLDVDLWENLVLDIAASRLDREVTTKRLRGLVQSK